MAFSTAFPSGSRLGEGGGAGTLLISLNSSFKAAYVRTNRVGGAKHMLCFPACDPRVAQCEGAPHCDGHAIRVGVQGRIPAAGGAAAALPKGLRVCAQVVDHANRAKPISKQKPRKVKSQSNRSPHSPPLGENAPTPELRPLRAFSRRRNCMRGPPASATPPPLPRISVIPLERARTAYCALQHGRRGTGVRWRGRGHGCT